MISRESFLKEPEYWFESFQNDIFREVSEYMESEGLNQSELASRLGVSKGYISQILNGNFNFTVKKLIELGASIGVIPMIKFKSIDHVLADDHKARIAYTTSYEYDNVLPIHYINGDCKKDRTDKIVITNHSKLSFDINGKPTKEKVA